MLKLKFTVAVISLISLLVLAFYANEARKEIYYLCANFSTGTSYLSVIRQLETTNLSGYKVEDIPQGKLVTHSSKIHLHLVSCRITFNAQQQVVAASYD